MSKSVYGSIAVLVVLAAVMVGWHFWHPKPPSDPAIVSTVTDFDSFQRALAEQVRTRFKVDPNSVVVAPAAYDLGTLLDEVQATPSDATDCVPNPAPKAIEAAHLFPSYQLSSETAASMTLGSDELQRLTQASASVAHNASVVYSITDVHVLLMDEKTVSDETASGNCGDYVKKHPGVRLIRGVVEGKISFTLKAANPSSVKAKLPKLMNVEATSDPESSTVTVADVAPTQILEMLWIFAPADAQGVVPVGQTASPEVQKRTPRPVPTSSTDAAVNGMARYHSWTKAGYTPESPTASGRPTAPLPVPWPTAGPAAASAVANIYLQQDIADAPDAGAKVARALAANWPDAHVEQRVESIASAKMPGSAQVRFFNAEDAALAAQCHDHLKAATGLDARVVRIGLGAPARQLEVWLPKAGTTH